MAESLSSFKSLGVIDNNSQGIINVPDPSSAQDAATKHYVDTKTTRAATLIVAASNSKDTTHADYICTGTGDQSTINTALSALPSTGGSVVLMDGTYSLNGAINIPHSNVTLAGQGWSTVLSVANATNANIINFNPGVGAVMQGVVIKDLEINANGANQTSGNTIYGLGAIFSRFENLHIKTPYDYGIHLYTDNIGDFGHHNTITRCTIENGTASAGAGIAVYLDQSDENVVAFNTFQGNGRGTSNPYHVYDTAGLNTIAFNEFVTGGIGVKEQGSNSKILGNTFDGCGAIDGGNSEYCQVHITGDKNTVSENGFYNIGFAGTANNTVGILVDNNQNGVITDNLFVPYSNTTNARAGIDMDSYPPTGYVVTGNTFSLVGAGTATWGVSAITPGTGAGHVIANNQGYSQLVTKSGTYTATLGDQVILANAASAGFTITLPTAVGNTGKTFRIKKIDSTTNTVTIATTSAQTIDGSTTATISVQYVSVDLVSDGSNWNVV